jgi:hypothetical protein
MATITQFDRPDEEYEGWRLEGGESTSAKSDKKRPYEQDVRSKPNISSNNGTQISRNEAGKRRKQADSEIKANVKSDNGKRFWKDVAVKWPEQVEPETKLGTQQDLEEVDRE